MKIFRKILVLSAIFMLATLSGGVALAVNATPAPLVDVNFPCPSGLGLGPCPTNPSSSLPDYLNTLFMFAIGIAGLLALGMIVAGGVYYTVSAGSSDKQREAKSMITSAIFGVILLFASYLILNTINPEITKLNLSFTNIQGGSLAKISTSTTGGIQDTSSKCPDFAIIPISPRLANTVLDPTCGFRRNYLTAAAPPVSSGGKYYDSSFSIGNGSVIWTYPYYIGSDTTTAQCLIYAYQEPNKSTVLTTLNKNLRMCSPQGQSPSVKCSVWEFVASKSTSPSGPWSYVEAIVNVTDPPNPSFNYTDPTVPPPTVDQSGGVPGTSICSGSVYCKDRAWYCVKYR